MAIDRRFLDVDFGYHARAMGRQLGATPRKTKAGTAGIPLYADVRNVIPRKDWPELVNQFNQTGWPQRKLITFVHDQNGEGSCVSNSFVGGHEVKQAEQYGRDKVVRLSPVSVYHFVGGGVMGGSSLDDNLRRMLDVGALPLDTPENKARFKHTHPHNGYYTPLPSGYEATANLFRDAEYADIGSMDEFVSALLSGHIVHYARSGHCILGVSLQYDGGSLVLDYLNSWSLDWGGPVNDELKGGLGHDSERVLSGSSEGSIALLNVQSPYGAAA